MGWFKIGDLFTLQMGKTPARSNSSFWGNGHIWVSISDLSNCNKYIASSRELITDDAVQESGIRIVPQGTLIMSFKLSLGKTAITASNLYTNEAIMAFIDKKIVPLDINYVYHLFNNWDWSRATNKAVMGLTLNKATLSQIKIPIPSLNTQKAIANILDKIDESITLRKRQLEIFNQLVKSRFIEMFGDSQSNPKGFPYKRINEFAKCIAGATPSTKRKEYWSNGIIPWMSSGEVNYKRIWETEKRISQMGYDSCSTKMIPAHTVVIAMAGQGRTRGTVAVAEIPLCTNQSLCSIITDGTVDTDYLFTYLQFQYNNLRNISNGSSGRGGLNIKLIGQFTVLVPPLAIQQKFSNFLKEIDKSKMAVQKSLDELETLKKSLMQTYFG